MTMRIRITSNEATLVLAVLLIHSGCKQGGGNEPKEESPTAEEAVSTVDLESHEEAVEGDESNTDAVAETEEVLPATDPPDFDPQAVADASAGMNAFAVELYAKLRSRKGNIVFSPTSIAMAFAMLQPGARGRTAEEIAQVMHFDLPPDKLCEAYASLLGEWNREGKEYELAVANRLFGHRTVKYEQEFLDRAAGGFGAPLEKVNFSNPEPVRNRINSWVAETTHDKIKNILPPGAFTEKTILALVNALYFKGQWVNRFDKENTWSENFIVNGVTKKPVKMMRQKGAFYYAHVESDGVQTLEMPYKGNDLSMVVVLPLDEKGLPKVEKSLTADKFDKWLRQSSRRNVKVKLPCFRIESPTIQLKPLLTSMGLKTAFKLGAADFTGIAPSPPLFVDDAIHKAFVEVDEEGTEGAAASTVIYKASRQPPPRRFFATHPFLFLIRDTRTGAILFFGRVTNPKM